MERQIAKANNTDDCWYGVRDPRKRKRIQDRLAQRARRKRLAVAIQNTATPLVIQDDREASGMGLSDCVQNVACMILRTGDETYLHESDLASRASMAIPSSNHPLVLSPNYTSACLQFPPTPGGDSEITAPDASSTESLMCRSARRGRNSSRLHITRWSGTSLSSDHRHLDVPKDDFVVALGICGSLLGISCGLEVQRSSRPIFSVPEILHPSPLQLTVPHYSWIDRWPFPRLRDNLIILAQTVNIEELVTDVFTMETCTIKKGRPPWDPNAWEISADFREKWGFLFH
jgi:hypothetical protein